MSYNGTVRCSYCYQTGHNKRGCPKLKADIERRREVFGDDDFRVRWHESHKARTSRKGEKRSCTYCGEMGHNRRTCPTLGAHVAKIQAASIEYRKALVEGLQATRLGVGAMLVHTNWLGDQTRYIVTAIDWSALGDLIDMRHARAVEVRSLSNLTAPAQHFALPSTGTPAWDEHMLGWGSSNVRLLTPSKAPTPPADFLMGMTVKRAKVLLKEQESWNWDDCRLFRQCAAFTDMNVYDTTSA
tara:strand:+ start:642 stop:1367 length:726 start_codon:yes stop_codon:yes gene_type:complete